MANIILRVPIPSTFIKQIPDVGVELRESLVFALLLFEDVIRELHGKTMRDWNHITLKSRSIAAAVGSMAFKFVMDHAPAGPTYFFRSFIEPTEFSPDDDDEQIMKYVAAFEARVLSKYPKLNMISCCQNHYIDTKMFLLEMKRQKSISNVHFECATEISFFFAFHYMLDRYDYEYMNLSTLAGVAIALLSIESLTHGGFDTADIGQLHTPTAYDFAATIAHRIATIYTKRHAYDLQAQLFARFADKCSWQHACTKQINVLKCSIALRQRFERLPSAAQASYGLIYEQ
jgi:hypothetical protein